jgi:hypothetical protein
VGWPLGYFWPSLVTLLGFIPAVWLLSTRCHGCGYPAFADFNTDERLRRDQRFWTGVWGKNYQGVHLPLRESCTKCGTNFV